MVGLDAVMQDAEPGVLAAAKALRVAMKRRPCLREGTPEDARSVTWAGQWRS